MDDWQEVTRLLTDVHAHPTDDPRLSSSDVAGVEALARRVHDVPLARVCAMSSCTQDQSLVEQLAVRAVDEGVTSAGEKQVEFRPCFGERRNETTA